MNIYFIKNIRVYIFIYRNSIRIRTLQVHINGILDILCVRIIVWTIFNIRIIGYLYRKQRDEKKKIPVTKDGNVRGIHIFSFFFFIFFPFCLIFNRAKWTCQNPLPIRAGGKWEGDESGWWLSNTRGGACNSEAAPYFNIVPSYIMFQQNGRRTRGSSAPSTGRVVYLEYTIPPRATLTLSLSFSLSPFLPPSLSLSLFVERGSVRKGGEEGDEERKREKNREGGERKKKRKRETVDGRRFKGIRVRERERAWRSTTTLGNQRPPLATLHPSLR